MATEPKRLRESRWRYGLPAVRQLYRGTVRICICFWCVLCASRRSQHLAAEAAVCGPSTGSREVVHLVRLASGDDSDPDSLRMVPQLFLRVESAPLYFVEKLARFLLRRDRFHQCFDISGAFHGWLETAYQPVRGLRSREPNSDYIRNRIQRDSGADVPRHNADRYRSCRA